MLLSMEYWERNERTFPLVTGIRFSFAVQVVCQNCATSGGKERIVLLYYPASNLKSLSFSGFAVSGWKSAQTASLLVVDEDAVL